MRPPVKPEMMEVFLCTTEFAYFRAMHQMSKQYGLPENHGLAVSRKNLEIALALYVGHRRVFK